jgi:mono/diheme cytochrome c family protein
MIERYVSPAEFRRLLSALLVVATFLVLMAFFAFVVVPGLREAQAPVPSATQADTGWLDPAEVTAARSRVIPPVDPATLLTPNPQLLERGRALYGRTCATCHGAAGRGDGPGGAGLRPPPRDFTRREGWKNGPRVEEIYRTLEAGLPGSSMVPYTDLSRRDRMALVHVVQSYGAFDHGASDPRAREALSRLFATTGEVIPNRIPLSRALEALVREDLQPRPLPACMAAILDPPCAARTLAGIKGWRDSDQALASGVVAGLPFNGFATAVALYSPAQWRDLRVQLSRSER